LKKFHEFYYSQFPEIADNKELHLTTFSFWMQRKRSNGDSK
jgi:hypothetical protein